MPTYNNSTTINFTQSDYNSNKPSIGTDGGYDKSMRFANKTVTLNLGDSDYGLAVFEVTYTGTLDYVSVGFFDPNGGFVSVSQNIDGLYRPVKTTVQLDEYKIKNGSYVNPTNTFYVVVNVEDKIKSELLNVCVAMGKIGTPPTTSSATISYNCPTPLYSYQTGLHVYSPYDAIAGESKLTTVLYSRTPIEQWVTNTKIYASPGFNNPALPYYYGYGDNVYKVGGIFDRSYGTQMQVTVTKKLFRSPKTTYETFGPQLWFDSGDQTSDACTMPFIEGVGQLRSVVSKTSLTQPEQYRYYMGYDPTVIRNSNDSVFTKYLMTNNQSNPVVGSTHALSKLLLGIAQGYDRSWGANDWAQGATLLGLALLAPLGAAISTSAIGTSVAAWFSGLMGPFSPWGITLFTNVGQWITTALVNPWVLGAIVLIAVLVILFGKKTKRYREECKQFLHHFTNTPYIEVSDVSNDVILYRDPELTEINNGYYCDGVYYYQQTGGKIVSKEISYTNAMVNEDPLVFKFQYSLRADDPTNVTDYNSLIVLAYTSGKPLPHCGTGTIYYNNGNLSQTITPNCCDLEIGKTTTITVENFTEFSCVSQQDANDKALAVFNAAVDYAENYANYCDAISDEVIGEFTANFTHEIKIENTPTQTLVFFDNRVDGAVIGKALYYDVSGCQKALDGYYGVTGSTPYYTFYHTTNGVIDEIHYMTNSNSTTTTSGEPILTTDLDYSSNWFMNDTNVMTLTYLTNSYDNDKSFDPNSLYSNPNLKKGYIKNLTTLEDFQIYDNFNTLSHSEANTGWYRPLIEWIYLPPFYYYKTQTMTLDVVERCSLFNRGFFINSSLGGLPTTTTNPVSMVVNVYTENIGLSGTYNVTTSKSLPSTFVKYGSQIGIGETVSGITINNITTPNPLNKTTYTIGSSTICNGETPGEPADCSEGMDVVFLVDYTGSMGAAINGVKTSISSIVNTIQTESNNNYRLGLVLFDEYTSGVNSTYSSKSDYTSLPSSQKYINTGIGGKYQWITAMEMMQTNNQTSFTTQLNKLNTTAFPLGSGATYPEPSDMGVDLVGTDNFAGTFRSGVSKLIILITDATPGGNDDIYNQTDIDFVNSLITPLRNQNIRVLLMKTYSGSNVLNDLATGTNGLVTQGFSGENIITAIQEICP